MKITIEQPRNGVEEVIFRCGELTPELIRLISELKMPTTLVGYIDSRIQKVKVKDICYCEVVDDRTFLYTAKNMYESKQRLYELEDVLGTNFIRISKSIIVNVEHIKSLRPAINGRFEGLLDSGETVIISRRYVPALKKNLGI